MAYIENEQNFYAFLKIKGILSKPIKDNDKDIIKKITKLLFYMLGKNMEITFLSKKNYSFGNENFPYLIINYKNGNFLHENNISNGTIFINSLEYHDYHNLQRYIIDYNMNKQINIYNSSIHFQNGYFKGPIQFVDKDSPLG